MAAQNDENGRFATMRCSPAYVRFRRMLLGVWQGMMSYRLMVSVDDCAVVDLIPHSVTERVEIFLSV
jgi:hypothetical protein